MEYTLRSFITGLLAAALVLCGVIVLANSRKEDIEEKPMSLVPFFGFSVQTEAATSTSVSYVGLVPLQEKVEVQTDVDLTEVAKKFGCPPVIPMRSDWIKQYHEQYHIVTVNPRKLTFFWGINGRLVTNQVIGPKLVKNLPQGWKLCTSDKIGDIVSELDLKLLHWQKLEWERVKADLQDITHWIIEYEMMKREIEVMKKLIGEIWGVIKVPYPVVYERMLQDAVTIRRELYPLMPSEPEKPKKPTLPLPFRFDISTIAIDPSGELEQYNIATLTLSENWFYIMEETK